MTTPAAECVVDTSVAFKWYVAEGEASVDQARDLLSAHARREIRLITPGVMPFELMNVLRYAGLNPDELREAAEAFAGFDLEVAPADAQLLMESARLALEHGLTIYDASFAALAALRGCDLVTADRKAFGSIDECVVKVI